MCGICGITYAVRSRPVDRGVLAAMNGAIRHRGPDSEGFHFGQGAGIAARRLAIIDVAGGDQPISNEDATVHVVFNGEIYNHEQLRAELRQRGHSFTTHADTEVIVHAYEEYGADCVQRLRGMFAFAVWDQRTRTLLLARDRVGKKPLYYALHDGALLFGSELKCLLRYPGFSPSPDLRAINDFLSLHYVPDPLSAFVGVHKLPPAHVLTWREGQLQLRRYWELSFEPKQPVSYGAAQQLVREKVTEAVRIRLMSDVPLGAHLSGGVDSAIVVGLMAEMMNRPVSTFSVGFREEAYSELKYARLIAERFRTDHHELVIEPDALDVLPRMVEHFDEPFADAAAIPLWYLSQFTRGHVTVALNGDGGDEAFAGYQRYYADPAADAYAAIPGGLRRRMLDPLLAALPSRSDVPPERSLAGALRRLSRAATMPQGASVMRWGSYFDEADKRELFRPDIRASFEAPPAYIRLDAAFRSAHARNRVDRTLATDLLNYLPGALLVKADRMTMAHSLEARSPLLDHELLELAATLPVRYKLSGRRTKRILRDAFANLFPPGLAKRPKMGFGVPLAAWFRGPLQDAAHDLLLGPGARIHEYLRSEPIARLLAENRRAGADHGKRIWALLNLECWLRQYVPVHK
jgi:asparagine synthase (glutamine-hydrolysing)